MKFCLKVSDNTGGSTSAALVSRHGDTKARHREPKKVMFDTPARQWRGSSREANDVRDESTEERACDAAVTKKSPYNKGGGGQCRSQQSEGES